MLRVTNAVGTVQSAIKKNHKFSDAVIDWLGLSGMAVEVLNVIATF